MKSAWQVYEKCMKSAAFRKTTCKELYPYVFSSVAMICDLSGAAGVDPLHVNKPLLGI